MIVFVLVSFCLSVFCVLLNLLAESNPTSEYIPVINVANMTDWAPGYPKDGTAPYHCGRIGTTSADGKWTTSPCADLNGYLCQAAA